MQFSTTSASPVRRKSACLIVGVFESGPQSATTREIDEASGGLITRLHSQGDITGKPGESYIIAQPPGLAAERLLLTGCGKAGNFNAAAYRKALATACARVAQTRSRDALIALGRDGVDGLDAYYLGRQSAETASAATYRYDELKTATRKPGARLAQLTVALSTRAAANQAAKGLADGAAVAAGVRFARDLANRPPNICHPTHLAEQARKLAGRHRHLEVEVLGEAQMKKLGMGAMLSVGMGSEQPSRLIVMKYRGAPAKRAPIALVGKAITFDTGGISLKPPPGMDEMKFDMGGGAAILGTMAAIAELKPALNVVAIVPACENMPSGRATRPGDIVRTMAGHTVEILNTDAEGRLILCDAITYARRFKPELVIDAATLTGACVVALGHQFTAVFTADEPLAHELLAAGERVGDAAWRLPVNEEYAESLKSNFADFANVGVREGGASIAAAYLAKFAEGLTWAHLDVAGSAWRSGKDKGATGRPVQLLAEFLLARQ
ncbi:MAG: leucyl aminopeptidase [Gammaproteobacteria bacterium]|nr:leucyl aminopeptidase [Gammaproteobacteria bacterium]